MFGVRLPLRILQGIVPAWIFALVLMTLKMVGGSVDSDPMAASPASNASADEFELFEGPEKTLTLSFKRRRMSVPSLRTIPQSTWEGILKHAKCEILSTVETSPPKVCMKGKDQVCHSKGVTAYLLSESSLFVTDNTLTMKTCGRTTPLNALNPILDLVVPNWRKKGPAHYTRYATYMRLGYMRPEDQISPHTSWEEEVQMMDAHFKGESVVLGSETNSVQHAYVANYLPATEIVDTVSTQVALTNLNTPESMRRFGKCFGEANDLFQLAQHWTSLHGNETRSVTSSPTLDERMFEPFGYSSNAVYGKHFTTIHVTPQPGCSYISVETSMPMTRDGRQKFVEGAQSLCTANTMAVTEFSLSPQVFSGQSPRAVNGFQLIRTTSTAGRGFSMAHHHYEREVPNPWSPVPPFQPAEREEEAQLRPRILMVDETAAGGKAAVSAAKKAITSPNVNLDSPIALVNLTVLRERAELWWRLLPRVEPFYAVKCNNNSAIVKGLWELWQERGYGGFDCASPLEIDQIAGLSGIDIAEQTVFANPCKTPSAIRHSRELGIRYTTFDNMSELEKIAAHFPDMQLLIRVQTDDSLARVKLSNKFGAAVADCPVLLARAKELGLKVVGVSFHVGSGCTQNGVFRDSLISAREVFSQGTDAGYNFDLLDIGGGFPGWDDEDGVTFESHALDINEMLEKHFPSPDLRIIAEPGRFFAALTQSQITSVVSVAEAGEGARYYLNDGLYGSFNCLLYDHAELLRPTLLRDGEVIEDSHESQRGKCTIFGPTCDGFDVIAESMRMPKLKVGDNLVFHNMGAYTTAASTSFNGFMPAETFLYQSA